MRVSYGVFPFVLLMFSTVTNSFASSFFRSFRGYAVFFLLQGLREVKLVPDDIIHSYERSCNISEGMRNDGIAACQISVHTVQFCQRLNRKIVIWPRGAGRGSHEPDAGDRLYHPR